VDVKQTLKILQYNAGSEKEIVDEVVNEFHIQLIVNDRKFLALLCTPKSLKELIVGFLYTEEIIACYEDIKCINIDEHNEKALIKLNTKDSYKYIDDILCGERTVTSGCGKGRTISYPVQSSRVDMNIAQSNKIEINRVESFQIDKAEIIKICHMFNKMSELFLTTGGVHSCALAQNDHILIMEEDIGRHNALDKIIGRALINHVDVSNKILLTSGRVSSEIMHKLIKSKIPVIVSRSAPTDKAVALAKKYGIILIGFARGTRMNVYTY